MPNVVITNAVPKNLEWWGIGREVAASTPFVSSPGTLAVPNMTIPLNGGAPDDAANLLVDKSLRGDMGEDFNEIVGTVIGQFQMAGNVYLDSIGHMLYNLFGDYTNTGTSASGITATGISAPTAVGAVAAVTLTGGLGSAVGSAPFYVQFGTGSTAEVIACSALTTTTATPIATGPGFRFIHATGTAVTQVIAPFTHKFALLNGTGSNGVSSAGLSPFAQPPTHTITHFNGLSANAILNSSYTGYRQYGYWCTSGMDFSADVNNLFQHSTRGVSYLGQDVTSVGTIANSQSDASANPNWRFNVAIGSALGGAGALNNIEAGTVSLQRGLVPKYTLANQQNPVTIARLGLGVTGRLTYLAQDESPLLQMLAGTQQQLQIGISPAYTPVGQAAVEGIVFNFQRAQFEAATLGDPDLMAYDVPFRALMNTTDVGISGARGPVTVTLINGIPTY